MSSASSLFCIFLDIWSPPVLAIMSKLKSKIKTKVSQETGSDVTTDKLEFLNFVATLFLDDKFDLFLELVHIVYMLFNGISFFHSSTKEALVQNCHGSCADILKHCL